ncbi:hypothetical protein SSP24_06030 [Streptomyces spinoverrucosus]|uniref:Uncharacterized protein n=1 Tax=Streptomyces spinoverrucosus TaxID=284043 RepID=A0A4Y3VA38_9ACTN|nr:hypothetical protein [Streptomyces spinoverrucosus]GEC02948.1 hypothetical protein SSP24_06030 [Streptomyces spinoverrucosus]GHB39366.1 hypothetical protein GCM10010397_06560 [Streptomyces spinoverrucosus]
MVAWPFTLTGEILVDGAWQPVKMRQDPTVTVYRGLTAESSQAQPTRAEVTLDNDSGAYSLRNPNSPLFGKIGPYTPFRLRVADLPPDPAPVMVDEFDRTVSDGWGTSTSGNTWVIHGSTPASNYSVADGTGRINLVMDSVPYIRTQDVSLTDVDATFTVATDQRAQDGNAENAIFVAFLTRFDPVRGDVYSFNIGFRADTGLPGDQGLRLAVNVVKFIEGAGSVVNNQTSPRNLTYIPGIPVRVRVQCVGPNLRMRVWADGQPEPEVWHSQGWDDTITGPGQIGFRAFLSAADTTAPFLVHVGDLSVAEPATDPGVTRLSGEVTSWKPQRDRSGNNKTTAIEPAGLLRRLSTGQPVLKSLLRRRIPTLYPLAYWPFEEGVQGDTQVADATLNSNAGVLTVRGLDFGQEDTLLGSDPLPLLTDNAGMSSPAIPGEATGYWSVSMLVRINSDDFPTDSSEHRILRFLTTGSNATIWALSVQLDAGSHRMRLRAYDSDGVELGSVTTTHEAATASTDPDAVGFLDGWRHIRVRVAENGSSLNYAFEWRDDTDRNWGNSATLASTSAGHVNRIVTTFGAGVKGMAIGHLTVWGVQFTSAYYHSGTASFGGASSMAGQPGLTARAFLDRLAGQESVALQINGEGSERLGPYPAGTALELVQAAADTEMGLLTDARDKLQLTYQTRDSLYNRPPDLVLNFADGQVFDPFHPTDDDKDARNQFTVKRREGSEYTAELTSGRLSVQPPPDGMGPVPTSLETIVHTDDQLPGQAAWRLHVATIDRMRVTQLTLEMANERMRPLIDQVLRLDVGSRIQITDTPHEYTPDGFDLLVLGYKETFQTGRWSITFNCLPYDPWTVGAVVLSEDFSDTDYAFSITFGGNAPWFRSQAHYNSPSWSLRSGAIGNNQTSDAVVAIPPGATELTFWYWTSSEAAGPGFEGDRLLVLVDGVQVLRAQGTTPWTQTTIDVTGKSVVTFRYAKDNSAAAGEDAVYIDDLTFTMPAPMRVDANPGGTTLALASTATATQLLVHTPAPTALGPTPWITSEGPDPNYPEDFPLDIRFGGEVARLQKCVPAAWDTFTRTVANSWGAADSGLPWVDAGGVASDRSVNGTAAVLTLAANRDVVRFQRIVANIADCEVLTRVSVDQIATGAALLPAILLRYTDTATYYRARLHFGTAGTMAVSITRGTTTIGTTPALTYTYTAGQWFWLRARLTGHRVQVRAWPDGQVEPGVWHADQTITTDPINSGQVGLAGSAFANNTNVNPQLRFDDFRIPTPQVMTVQRSLNGAVKAHTVGTEVRLARPAVIAL